MKTAGVTDYTNQTLPKHFGWINYLSPTDLKIRKYLYPLSVVQKKMSKFKTSKNETKGALAWYGKLTWESAHAWILKILCYLIVWGITLIFMVHLSFYAIPLLIYDVMNDITIIP